MADGKELSLSNNFGVSNIRTFVPLNLDLEELNYDSWRELFEIHCLTFDLSGHLDGTTPVNQLETMTRIQTISDLLENIDSTVADKTLVTYMVNGLPEKYDNTAEIITHKHPFPTFLEAHSKLLLAEKRLKNRRPQPTPSHTDHSSNPMILYTDTNSGGRNNGNRNNSRNSGRNNGGGGIRSNGGGSGTRKHNNNGNKFNNGNNNNIRGGYENSGWNISSSRPFQQIRPSNGNRNSQQTRPINSGLLGPGPHSPYPQAYTTEVSSGMPPPWRCFPPHNSGDATSLTQAFSACSIQDPGDDGWYMDTGAIAHLASDSGKLNTIFNKNIVPSVIVGDGSTILVLASGNATLPNPYRPLDLHNVLVTPNIVKNLIYVKQFNKDNKTTIEFDDFGFSVKDARTRHTLLRCDSSGDLYPVTSSKLEKIALLSTSQPLWHNCLGHPGDHI
ncbi:uncharacterized protein [Rutidosis leptorrhynchoides]|uniref:uncharacterized protein n=1 Tax=Rutidosis leptorrhynchoides TaxID=125765 RepID=UPI003A99DED0